jgi:hypothetical protein
MTSRGKAGDQPPGPQLEVYDSTTMTRAGGPPTQRGKPDEPPAAPAPAASGPRSAATQERSDEGRRRPWAPGPARAKRAPTEPEILSSKDDGTSTKDKADRAPADWEHFAPMPEEPPRRRVRVATAVGRVVGHEWSLVILAGLAIALVLNWRALGDPRHSLPRDLADPSAFAYLIAWAGHALGHDATNLWHLNTFFPAPLGLAYGDTMLGYAPLGLIGTGPETAMLRYNLILVAGHAVAVVGPYALARQLGLARMGAAVVAAAVALAPWRLGEAGHLNVLSAGAAILALAMLARAHGVRWRRDDEDAPRPRPEWALPGWLLAAWQVTVGFGVGVVAVYVIAAGFVIGLVRWGVRRRGRPNRWLVLADAIGVLFLAGATVFVARAQLRVLDLYPDANPVAAHSPSLRGLLTAPAGSLVWGGAHATSRDRLPVPGEMALLPGFALYALAAAGVVFSVWALWVRLALLAGTIVSVVLVLGTRAPGGGKVGYLWVVDHVPGFGAQREPGRLILWTTLLLGLLAAGGVCALFGRAREVAQRGGWPAPTAEAMAALLLPVALIMVEGLGVPAYRSVPAAPAALASVRAPYLVLPTGPDGDADVMLWSTDRYADLVNGAGPLEPTELSATRAAVRAFPDVASVEHLRRLGVRTVVLLPDRIRGTPWERAAEAPVEALGITRESSPGVVIFRLG